jgi:hypothetical protein
MSYSFQVKATSRAGAKDAVAAEFDKMVEFQKIHARDKAIVLANANAVIDLVEEPADDFVLSVTCNGYLSWTVTDPDVDAQKFSGVSVNCAAYIIKA